MGRLEETEEGKGTFLTTLNTEKYCLQNSESLPRTFQIL